MFDDGGARSGAKGSCEQRRAIAVPPCGSAPRRRVRLRPARGRAPRAAPHGPVRGQNGSPSSSRCHDVPRRWLAGASGLPSKYAPLIRVAQPRAWLRRFELQGRERHRPQRAVVVHVVRHLRDRRSSAPLEVEFEFTPSATGREVHPLLPRASKQPGLLLRSRVYLDAGSTSLSAEAEYVDSHGKRIAGTPAKGTRGMDPIDHARDKHTPRWFVAGYGISRALPDAAMTPPFDRPSIDRMQPLFDSQARLASTSFSNHFARKDSEEDRPRGTTSRLYSRMLNEAIKLGGSELLPGITKLELRGQGGARNAADLIESDRFHQQMGHHVEKIAGVALSHGYQSTFAWIADLIGQFLLESKTELSTVEIEGLVLLDEIDLYLHPAWQATFVTALRRVFPKIQFVATTHSPVILAGLAPTRSSDCRSILALATS